MGRAIVHMDADAFYASVEQAADPRLRGKPIAVGGDKRGIIASASYEARRMGIYTPMPSARARKLCPNLILLPGDFEKYEQFSRWMFSYAYDFTPTVEISSIDEGYLDLTGSRRSAQDVAKIVRRAIYQSLKISVSEGIGTNKLISQIASKLRKPQAFIQVPPGQEKNFLKPLPNRWLPGIGPQTALRMNAAGLARIGQIAATPVDCLALLVGRTAPTLQAFANGIDERPVEPAEAAAKSYGKQHTFDEDTTDEAMVEASLRRMADSLMAAVRADGKMIRTVTVKVRYNDRSEHQRSESLGEPTDIENDLYSRLRPMLRQAWHRRVSLRMVSLRLSNIYAGFPRAELPLNGPTQTYDARRRLAEVVRELRHDYGSKAAMRGHDWAPNKFQISNLKSKIRSPNLKSKISNLESPYIPLHTHSHYSFLDSTLSPQAIVDLAVQHECPAIALTDTGNLHGAVPFFQAAVAVGIKPIIGAEITIDKKPLLLYAENQLGYTNLCRILSHTPATLQNHDTTGLIAIAADPALADLFPHAFYLGVGSPKNLKFQISNLKSVVVPATHYALPSDRRNYDIVQSIRTQTLLGQSHPDKRRGPLHFRTPTAVQHAFREHPEWIAHTQEIADRCSFVFEFGRLQFPSFKPPDGFSPHTFLRNLVLQGLHDKYAHRSADLQKRVQNQIEQELAMIAEVGYEEYFLVVWDLLQTCRAHGIEWITRGSAADSLVCYCLDISDVCPIRFDLYFQRFLNRERMQMNKLPDIDIDFAHDRKDDVVDLLFRKYGPEHTAIVGGFSTFQSRSALADVAKVLGVADHQIRQLTKRLPYHSRPSELKETVEKSIQCRDLPLDEEPYATALAMSAFLDGVPRNPKQHPCGVVLSHQPMASLTPCFTSAKGYPTTHFDMDAVEDIGLVKIDILAQGGLAVMRDTMEAISKRKPETGNLKPECLNAPISNLNSPPTQVSGFSPQVSSSTQVSGFRFQPSSFDDPAVWDLISSGQARAVHHIESPAMISLSRMCNVRDIDTLIAVVSVIRPGAANQKKKQHFTLRYQGLEPTTYPHPSLERCLKCTFGMLVYEEQVLQICDAFAGMPPGDADRLRRALNKRNWDLIKELGKLFYQCAQQRRRTPDDIRAVWTFVIGFNGYAFCKAHSTAYGVEAYQAAWLKLNHPAEFMAAVLTHGKGFYSTLVYILECYRLGIRLLPPRVNEPGPGYQTTRKPEFENLKPECLKSQISHLKSSDSNSGFRSQVSSSPPTQVSGLRFQPSSSPSIRVPLTAIKGLSAQTTARILAESTPFASLRDFFRRVHPTRDDMEILLRVGALDDFGDDRTSLFWQIQWLHRAFGDRDQGALFTQEADHPTPTIELTEPTTHERLRAESKLLGFTVSGHPLDLYPDIAWDTYCPVAELHQHLGEQVVCCGLTVIDRVVVHDTGESMKFLTLTDYTGMVETELFAKTYARYGLATIRYPVLEVTATVEPFANANGFTLNVHKAGPPRKKLNHGVTEARRVKVSAPKAQNIPAWGAAPGTCHTTNQAL